jgi:aminopeptidase N
MHAKTVLLAALLAFCAHAENENLRCYSAPAKGAENWSGTRQYARDRQIAVSHLALDITPDFKQRTIVGSATITFKPIAKSLEELSLDAVDLNVDAVESTRAIATYQVTDEAIVVTFKESIPANAETQVTIRYHAQPLKGVYFRTPEMGYKAGDEHLFTQGEAIESRHWFPSYDFPNEKFTTELTCHVPEGMAALSNGKLVSEDKDAKGLTAFHWSQDKPHANYLISLVAGYLKSVQDKYRDIPIAFYTPASEIAEAEYSFTNTPDMLAFYEKETGTPYPWAKYYQVAVNDFVEGGMENTSITTLTDRTLHRPQETETIRTSEGLTGHELAHQWFGDLVTCKDWSHIWLNEGFATYYELLYAEHAHGRDELMYGLFNTSRTILVHTNDTTPIVSRKFDNPDDLFNYLPYEKGSFVLQMLRADLGPDLYRKCIKTYLDRHQYGNVVTDDLVKVIDELSGRSYDKFFDQWVYHAHHPELAVEYSWDEKSKLGKISVKQTQKLSDAVLLFDISLPIVFKGPFGKIEKTAQVSKAEENFYFALPQAPKLVLLDPEFAILAKIDFQNQTPAMLNAALEDVDYAGARLVATEKFKDKKDHASLRLLKQALNGDAFYGVRIQAAKALQSIHSDESLAALIGSTNQPDARVRQAVVAAIAAFYNDKAFDTDSKIVLNEKNPDIVSAGAQGIGLFHKPTVPKTLLQLLNRKSFHDVLGDAAVRAMRAQDDPTYIPHIRDFVLQHESTLQTRSIAAAFEAIGYLGRNETNKDTSREFLLRFVNSKKKGVQLGAMRGLGLLEDPKAIAALETFASASKETEEQPVAEKAIADIRGARKPIDNLNELRSEVLELQKESRKLRADFEETQKKSEAQQKPKSPTPPKQRH